MPNVVAKKRERVNGLYRAELAESNDPWEAMSKALDEAARIGLFSRRTADDLLGWWEVELLCRTQH